MAGRGIERERQVRKQLEALGWIVARCAGSKGEFDLMCMRAESERMLVEVKSTAGGPYERFGPRDRADMLHTANLAGADAWLAYWPPRGQLTWIHEREWPK